ncbi:MAG TPA: family 16 glycosylhydrolase [Candidatus Nanopelagicales bacterium]|nr:family 16 glycosylhydrolase [Candidatus Nanopelagicales bacterium]
MALTWQPVASAVSYSLLRDGLVVGTTASTSWTDTGLVDGQTYSYTLTASDGTTVSAASAPVTATPFPPVPATPTGLAAAPGNTQVALSWTATAYAASYKVFRNGTQIATPTATSFTDSGLSNGTAYSYTVVATDMTGDSAATAAVSATPKPPLPASPTGLVATAGNAEVALSWTASSYATNYQVLRNGVVAASLTGTSFTDTGLTNGTAYSYSVVAANMTGPSAATAAVSATPQPPAPATPTGLAATAGNGQVALSWTASTYATGYKVLRNGTQVATPTATSFADSGLVNGTAYSYTVVASNGTGDSAATTAVSATPRAPAPATPTGLVATAGNAQVALSWTASAYATSYKVLRGGTQVGTLSGTSYVDTGLTNGTAYGYAVVASNTTGDSTATAAVAATPRPPAPTTPTGLVATAGNAQVSLSWTASANATSYKVLRNGTQVAAPTGTTFTDGGLTNGTAYSYTVVASNMTADSSASAAASATPTASSTLPPIPAGYSQTFLDDFTGSTVDSSKWNVRNNTSNSNEQSYLLASNVTESNGLLNITARRDSVGGKLYSSGYIDSIGKFSQRYGVWQVRAKVDTPIGTSQGMWPAPLWLRGDTSPMEVDLIEAWGTGPTIFNGYRAGSGSASIHQNTAGTGAKVSGWLSDVGSDLSAGFHVYECEWTPTYLSIRVDGVEKVRATPSNASWIFTGTDYAGNANMRVNLQVSKDTGYYGGPIASTLLPSTLQIDYIRVLTKAY